MKLFAKLAKKPQWPISKGKLHELQNELEIQKQRFSNATQRSTEKLQDTLTITSWIRAYPLQSSLVFFATGYLASSKWGSRIESPRMKSLPQHLDTDRPQGLIPGEPIAQYEIGNYKNFNYLILDWNSKTALIVDPQKDLSGPLDDLKSHQFHLSGILLTHSHHDHIAGVTDLALSSSSIPIYVHSEDAHRLPRQIKESLGQADQLRFVDEGDSISLGDLKIEVLHTPGHSAGECCFFVQTPQYPYLFTGDTLFIRDCGRTDLPTGSTEAMFHSLQKLKALSPKTVILPGHHYQNECASTLAQEMKASPPLQCRSVSELEALP